MMATVRISTNGPTGIIAQIPNAETLTDDLRAYLERARYDIPESVYTPVAETTGVNESLPVAERTPNYTPYIMTAVVIVLIVVLTS